LENGNSKRKNSLLQKETFSWRRKEKKFSKKGGSGLNSSKKDKEVER